MKQHPFNIRHVSDVIIPQRTESLNSKGRAAKFIYVALRAMTILSAVAMLIQREYGNFVLCVFTLLLFTLPDLIQQNFSIHLPSTLETIIRCLPDSPDIRPIHQHSIEVIKDPQRGMPLHPISSGSLPSSSISDSSLL